MFICFILTTLWPLKQKQKVLASTNALNLLVPILSERLDLGVEQRRYDLFLFKSVVSLQERDGTLTLG